MNPLANRFLLLLLAFPRHYRRSRGEEMLTTLLDGSVPGQRWPTLRSALSVVWSGIRCRFRLRPGKFSRIAAAVTTLTGAVFGAVLGSWMAWHWAAGALPSDAEADAIARSIVVAEPYSRERYDFLFGTDPGLGIGMPGGFFYTYDTDEHGDIQEARAMQVLRANGWTVSSAHCLTCGGPLDTAVKGDVSVIVTRWSVVIRREAPPAVAWFMAHRCDTGRLRRVDAVRPDRSPSGVQDTQAEDSGVRRYDSRILGVAALPVLHHRMECLVLHRIGLLARSPSPRSVFIFSFEPVRSLTFAGLAAILLALASAELPPRRVLRGREMAGQR